MVLLRRPEAQESKIVAAHRIPAQSQRTVCAAWMTTGVMWEDPKAAETGLEEDHSAVLSSVGLKCVEAHIGVLHDEVAPEDAFPEPEGRPSESHERRTVAARKHRTGVWVFRARVEAPSRDVQPDVPCLAPFPSL